MLEYLITNTKEVWQKHKYKILAGLSFSLAGYFAYKSIGNQEVAKWSSFAQAVKMDKVRQVVVDSDTVFFRSETSQWVKTYLNIFNPRQIWELIQYFCQSLRDKDIIFSEKQEIIPSEVYPILFSCAISIASFKYLMGSLNKKNITPIDLKGSTLEQKTYLDDYYGGEEIKLVFRQTIHFLKNPEIYEEMGARIRRGLLFYGPPGTGKTMLARALATEAGCQFIRVVASQFQELYVGVGPKRVRQLFRAARSFKQGCIIFIDQIDALGSRANHLRDSHQTTTTINQFLNQMDGFTQNQRIVVVAATNRLDLVDHAVLRSGRFDMKVHIPLPGAQQRKGILWKILDKKLGNLHDVKQKAVDFVCQSSQNWCGADIEALVNQSIYRAISQNSQKVEDKHLINAYQEMHQLR